MSETWFEDVALAESPFATEVEAPAEAWPSESAGLPPSWPEGEAGGGRGEQPFATEAWTPWAPAEVWSPEGEELTFGEAEAEEQAPGAGLSASRLEWPGAPAGGLAFMRAVYDKHVERSKAKGGTFVADLPDHQLGVIQGSHKARKDAAAAARTLLARARAALKASPSAANERGIGVISAYRPASRQFDIWQGKGRQGTGGFPYYYQQMLTQGRLHPGDYSPAAVAAMATNMAKWIAAPGYSNHQDGLAIDFGSRAVGGQKLRFIAKGGWFHSWLAANMAHHPFRPYPDEPWHWIYHGPGRELTVAGVPLLASHHGRGPDLILGWNVSSVPDEIDVVVHLHGFWNAGMRLDDDIVPYSGLDLAPVGGAPGQGRSRPTLTVLPRGNDTGKTQRIRQKDGSFRDGYNKFDFPALVAKKGFPDLVRLSLERFAAHLGGTAPRIGRLILTAHSGGGKALLDILKHQNQSQDRTHDPHQVHVFDALYQDPKELVTWAHRHIDQDRKALAALGVTATATAAREYMTTRGGALRVVYWLKSKEPKLYSGEVHKQLASKLDPRLERWYRVEESTCNHFEIPTNYGWRVLADASADIPDLCKVPATQPEIGLEPFDEWEEPQWAATEELEEEDLEEEEFEEEDLEEGLEVDEELEGFLAHASEEALDHLEPLDDEAESPGSDEEGWMDRVLEEEASRGETEDEAGRLGLELASPAATFESIAGEVLEGVLGQVSELGRLSEDLERVGRQFDSAPATEVDIADVVELGKGIGRLGQGIGAAVFVGPPSPAADVSVAVPEFNFLTRLKVKPPLLDAAANAEAVQWNGRHHPAISGVDPRNIRTDVARYVNLTVIAKAIQNFNAANPTKPIQLGTPPMDAVLVEAIHQFQAKCFFETRTTKIDGKAGESTLDSLGLVKRSGMNSVDQRNTAAHARLGRVDAAALTSNGFTADTWFDHMVNPSFLGWRFLLGGKPRGVHLLLMRKLRIAERDLLAQPKFAGKTPVELGEALGFNAKNEEHKGARPSAKTASMHTYGLAVDIGYSGNPWIVGQHVDRSGGSASPAGQVTQQANRRMSEVIGRAALLVHGERISFDGKYLDGLRTLKAGAIWDDLHRRDAALRRYLSIGDDEAQVLQLVQARIAAKTPGVIGSDENPKAAARRWREQAAADLAALKASGVRRQNARGQEIDVARSNFVGRDPRKGFLNLARDLVIALRDVAGLAWGAVDFGANESGDVMHFDCRRDGIGQLLNSPLKAQRAAKPR